MLTPLVHASFIFSVAKFERAAAIGATLFATGARLAGPTIVGHCSPVHIRALAFASGFLFILRATNGSLTPLVGCVLINSSDIYPFVRCLAFPRMAVFLGNAALNMVKITAT